MHVQLVENTLGCTNSFRKGGMMQHVVFEKEGEIEV